MSSLSGKFLARYIATGAICLSSLHGPLSETARAQPPQVAATQRPVPVAAQKANYHVQGELNPINGGSGNINTYLIYRGREPKIPVITITGPAQVKLRIYPIVPTDALAKGKIDYRLEYKIRADGNEQKPVSIDASTSNPITPIRSTTLVLKGNAAIGAPFELAISVEPGISDLSVTKPAGFLEVVSVEATPPKVVIPPKIVTAPKNPGKKPDGAAAKTESKAPERVDVGLSLGGSMVPFYGINNNSGSLLDSMIRAELKLRRGFGIVIGARYIRNEMVYNGNLESSAILNTGEANIGITYKNGNHSGRLAMRLGGEKIDGLVQMTNTASETGLVLGVEGAYRYGDYLKLFAEMSDDKILPGIFLIEVQIPHSSWVNEQFIAITARAYLLHTIRQLSANGEGILDQDAVLWQLSANVPAVRLFNSVILGLSAGVQMNDMNYAGFMVGPTMIAETQRFEIALGGLVIVPQDPGRTAGMINLDLKLKSFRQQ